MPPKFNEIGGNGEERRDETSRKKAKKSSQGDLLRSLAFNSYVNNSGNSPYTSGDMFNSGGAWDSMQTSTLLGGRADHRYERFSSSDDEPDRSLRTTQDTYDSKGALDTIKQYTSWGRGKKAEGLPEEPADPGTPERTEPSKKRVRFEDDVKEGDRLLSQEPDKTEEPQGMFAHWTERTKEALKSVDTSRFKDLLPSIFKGKHEVPQEMKFLLEYAIKDVVPELKDKSVELQLPHGVRSYRDEKGNLLLTNDVRKAQERGMTEVPMDKDVEKQLEEDILNRNVILRGNIYRFENPKKAGPDRLAFDPNYAQTKKGKGWELKERIELPNELREMPETDRSSGPKPETDRPERKPETDRLGPKPETDRPSEQKLEPSTIDIADTTPVSWLDGHDGKGPKGILADTPEEQHVATFLLDSTQDPQEQEDLKGTLDNVRNLNKQLLSGWDKESPSYLDYKADVDKYQQLCQEFTEQTSEAEDSNETNEKFINDAKKCLEGIEEKLFNRKFDLVPEQEAKPIIDLTGTGLVSWREGHDGEDPKGVFADTPEEQNFAAFLLDSMPDHQEKKELKVALEYIRKHSRELADQWNETSEVYKNYKQGVDHYNGFYNAFPEKFAKIDDVKNCIKHIAGEIAKKLFEQINMPEE